MARKHTINLRAILKEEVSLIFDKIPNSDLKELSQTCSSVKNFIEERKTFLSSRPVFGINLHLTTQNEVTITKDVTQKSRVINEGFYESIAYFSVKKLSIRLIRLTLIPEVLKIIKRWNPVCKEVEIIGPITKDVIEMIDNLRCQTSIKLTFRSTDNIHIIDDLKNTSNHAHIHLNMQYENITIYETLRPFYGFKITASADRVLQFLLDFQEAKAPNNLRQFSFAVPIPNRSFYDDQSFDDLLPAHSGVTLPPMEYLFAANNLEENGWRLNTVKAMRYAGVVKPSMVIAKLPLKEDNMCAIIHDTNGKEYDQVKIIDVTIMKDDVGRILDHLLETFNITNEVYTNEKRQQYFEMEDFERMEEMRRLYFQSRRDAEEEIKEKRIRLYNERQNQDGDHDGFPY